MKTDLQILKQAFTLKNIFLAILFNILTFGTMYGSLYVILFLHYDLGWI